MGMQQQPGFGMPQQQGMVAMPPGLDVLAVVI